MALTSEFQSLFDRYVAAYRTGDAKGCAAVFAARARMFSPYGPPVVGREEIEATHAEWVAEGAENKRIEVSLTGGEGGLAWCLAEYSEGQTGAGTSLNILERQEDGQWLITMCSLNEVPEAEV